MAERRQLSQNQGEAHGKELGSEGSDSDLSALQRLRHIVCSEPRMLTESEIKLLRQSKAEIAKRVSELVAVRKQRGRLAKRLSGSS